VRRRGARPSPSPAPPRPGPSGARSRAPATRSGPRRWPRRWRRWSRPGGRPRPQSLAPQHPTRAHRPVAPTRERLEALRGGKLVFVGIVDGIAGHADAVPAAERELERAEEVASAADGLGVAAG